MSDCKAVYACPASGCLKIFQTVKFMVDHLLFYHDGPPNAESFTCCINDCMFKSGSVTGYRLHMRRAHFEDWNRQRYKRSGGSAGNLASTCESDSNGPSVSDDVELTDLTVEQISSPVDYYSELQKK